MDQPKSKKQKVPKRGEKVPTAEEMKSTLSPEMWKKMMARVLARIEEDSRQPKDLQ